MTTKRHLAVFLAITLILGAISGMSNAWSMADFHPGPPEVLPASIRIRAAIGRALAAPFIAPTIWLGMRIGDSSVLRAMPYLFLPILYAALLYLPFFAYDKKKMPNQSPQPIRAAGPLG